ncbi:MAG: hypothetical protein R3B90_12460 [Planctomycetaceae bacterium]
MRRDDNSVTIVIEQQKAQWWNNNNDYYDDYDDWRRLQPTITGMTIGNQGQRRTGSPVSPGLRTLTEPLAITRSTRQPQRLGRLG